MPIIFVPQPSKSHWIPVFFIHIPKCGGTSIESSLSGAGCVIRFHDRFDNAEHSFLQNRLLFKCPSQHFHYEMLSSIFNLNAFDNIFVVVRNPFARLASEFRFMAGKTGLGDTLDTVDEWAEVVLDERERDPFHLFNHLRPQMEFVPPVNTVVYKLEDGLDVVLKGIFKRLKKRQGWSSRELDSPKLLLYHEKKTSELDPMKASIHEKILRANANLSSRIRTVYAQDFKSFYPEDVT